MSEAQPMTGDFRGQAQFLTLRPRRDLMERELEGELLLYDPDRDRVFLLNLTAAMIWILCEEEDSAESIAERLAERFQKPLNETVEDVRRTLDRFRDDGLLMEVR